jgi:hypothetical protein
MSTDDEEDRHDAFVTKVYEEMTMEEAARPIVRIVLQHFVRQQPVQNSARCVSPCASPTDECSFRPRYG